MKLPMSLFLGAALAVGCGVPTLSSAQQYQSDQERDRDRNTQAYNDGFAQGQADARSHAMRNDTPSSRWTKDDDTRAYRQGYDAGFQNSMSGAAPSAMSPGDRMASGDQQAEQFGYQDGLAAGRADQMKGKQFKPEDHDLYKDAKHGWTTTLGTKEQFKQIYRESFMKGYQEGYRGTGPR